MAPTLHSVMCGGGAGGGWLLRTGAPDGIGGCFQARFGCQGHRGFLPALCQQSFLEEEIAWSWTRSPGKERGRVDGQSGWLLILGMVFFFSTMLPMTLT